MAGRLSALHPYAWYTILSGDTGYDPAVRMLQEYGVRISRLPDVQATRQGTEAVAAEPQKKQGAKKEPVAEMEWRQMAGKACREAGLSKAEAGYVHANTWGIKTLTELIHALQTAYPHDQKIKKIPKLYKAMKKRSEAQKMLDG